jgi:hypothetical protein
LHFAWRFPAESRPQIFPAIERFGTHLRVVRPTSDRETEASCASLPDAPVLFSLEIIAALEESAVIERILTRPGVFSSTDAGTSRRTVSGLQAAVRPLLVTKRAMSSANTRSESSCGA